MNKHYLKKEQLKNAIVQYHAGDSTQLALAAQSIGTGLVGWMHGKGYEFDENEVVQEAVCIVLERCKNIRHDGNPFSYLTTIIVNHFRQLHRERKSYRDAIARYGRSLGAYGKAVQQDCGKNDF